MYECDKKSGFSSLVLEGTSALGRNSDKIGSIESAIIDRASGALSHVVLGVGRVGFIAARYLLPWQRLDYDGARPIA
jgi:hypothetical protein